MYQQVVGTPAARFRAAWDRPAVPWATALLCGLCVRMYLWGDAWSVGLARASDDIVLRGEVWRTLSYAFLHASPGHIVSNLSFLLFIGFSLERVVGPWAMICLWLTSTGAGGLLATWLNPGKPSVGASAADFGVLAAAAVVGWRWLDLIPAAARARFGGGMALFTLYALFNGFRDEGVDSWAHFGGLIAGGVFGALLRPVGGVGASGVLGGANARVCMGAMVGVAMTIGVVRVAGWRWLPLEVAEADGMVGERPSWWRPGWTPAGGMGWNEVRALDHARSGAGPNAATGRGYQPLSVGLSTERRGRSWSIADAVDDVLGHYRETDPNLDVERSDATLDGVPGVRLDLGWTAKGAVAMRSRVEVYLRGHYRHVYSWDAPVDFPASGLQDRVRSRLHLVDPAALIEATTGGVGSLRGRTVRGRALMELGRSADALQAFNLDDLKELRAAVGLCAPEPAPACVRPLSDATLALERSPADTPLRLALIDARLANDERTEALGLIDAGLLLVPGDAALSRLRARTTER
ncbi:MAG: rhomboid family intramembrane serine protease [Myxococcales bacterium]|nr:rhomboid family intramembrane serine protease [Myxococcales bacterium]